MHEWLSGGVSPCQGEGRGFESRLVLFLFVKEALIYKASFRVSCILILLQDTTLDGVPFLGVCLINIAQCSS